ETRRQNKFDLGGSTDQLSAHTASELNFKNLFDPAQKQNVSGGSAGTADFSLRSLMGTTLPRSKDQEARMNDFKQLINTPSQPQGSFAVASPPSFSQPGVGSTPAFTTRPPEPAASRPGDLFNSPSSSSLP